MNVSTEIKNKEDSLTALMSRILKEPLDPLSKSIHASMETLLDTKDKLDNIESIISVNVNHVEHMSKSLKRALNDIKDEVLPDHAQSIQRQFKTLSEAGFKNYKIPSLLSNSPSTSLRLSSIQPMTPFWVKVSANQELNQRALADLSQHCTASHQTLMASLQMG